MVKSKTIEQKNPAQFFADNQNIAGFDNPGKSLYTTIRELVENSLDAAESIGQLPDIELTIVELSPTSFAELRGLDPEAKRKDTLLYEGKKTKKTKKKPKKKKKTKKGDEQEEDGDDEDDEEEEEDETNDDGPQYYKIICKDNGCGMKHELVPTMFGRVLASSNYMVKQARGKYGLGAKMALIWSKKSTGLPIEVTTAHTDEAGAYPDRETYCKLDIDIHKNEPKIFEHIRRENRDKWHGSKVELCIAGKWIGYGAKIQKYLQQLAVITPYAQLNLNFVSEVKPDRGFTHLFERRSEQVCPPPLEVKHHPKSVDNLILEQLLQKANSTMKLSTFLSKQLACIRKSLADRLVEELSSISKKKINANTTCGDMTDKMIHMTTRLLNETSTFPEQSADCLSLAQEYNLLLGIKKEYNPDFVATAKSKPSYYGGHPFVVEAAVSVGGRFGGLRRSNQKQQKPGITVFRFANRIPLLFEAGSDVVSVVANKEMKWGTYKINPKADAVGVFVSIVSTKIPFKGTGKEYIGADVEEIKSAVLETIRKCANQLKRKLKDLQQFTERENRVKTLKKYVDNVSHSFFLVYDSIKQAHKKARLNENGDAQDTSSFDEFKKIEEELLKGQTLTSDKLKAELNETIEKTDLEQANQAGERRGYGKAAEASFFIVPGPLATFTLDKPINHPIIIFQPLIGAEAKHENEIVSTAGIK